MWLQETDKKQMRRMKGRGEKSEGKREEEERHGRVLALLARRMLGNFSQKSTFIFQAEWHYESEGTERTITRLLTRPRSQERATEGERDRGRERKEVSTEGATWSYIREGEERVCKGLGRKKREKKERDNEGLRRRRHRWEKEKRRNETTSSGSFFLRTDQPSLLSLSLSPNAERNNSPRGGRGLKSAATESPIIFRSLSFPPNQRIKASLRGPASISPPLPRSFLVRSTKEEEGETTVGWTNLCFS